MVYLTGSINIDDPEQISIQAKPQQLATMTKQGRKLEFNSCPLGDAVGLLGDSVGEWAGEGFVFSLEHSQTLIVL
jgi:inner membrane protein